MQMGGVMDFPRKPSTDEKLDLGYEIIEQLLLHREPLTDEQINRYSKMWIANRKYNENYYSIKLAHNALKESMQILSRCKCNEPVPEAAVQQLCLCSRPSVTNYTSRIMSLIRERMLEHDA
jgi:hypothetical protein